MSAPPAEACRRAREWLSAWRDGEAPDDAAARAHLAACGPCATWAVALDAITARTRVRVAEAAPDVVSPALAAWWDRAAAAPERQALVARVLLGLAGATAIVLSALVVTGVVPGLAGPDGHLGWELASFEAALGLGFCFAAADPQRYGRALLPVAAAAGLLTLHPLLRDLSRAAVDPLTEASHVPTLVGLAALLLLVDAARRRGALRLAAEQREVHA